METKKMNAVVYVKVSEIKPYPQNTKVHPREQIEDVATSIEEFGFKQPLVLDKDKVIIIGHCRYEASKILGLDEVPCIIADDLDEEQARKLRIADNKTNESDWDFEFLNLELSDLTFDEFNFEFPDFQDDEVESETELSDLENHEHKEKEIECPFCGEKILI